MKKGERLGRVITDELLGEEEGRGWAREEVLESGNENLRTRKVSVLFS